MDVEPVVDRVRAAAGAPRSGGQPADGRATSDPSPRRGDPVQVRPDPRDPRLVVEREVVKLVVQRPALAGPLFDGLGEECFTSPAYVAVRSAVAKAGGAARAGGGREWVAAIQEAAETDSVRELVTELAVEPMQSLDEEDTRYAQALLVRLEEMALTRRIEELKSKVQRLNPVDQAEEYNRKFGELIALEGQRKGLRGRAVGEL